MSVTRISRTRRVVVTMAGIAALTALAAMPAFGDSFTSTNAAPTVTNLAITGSDTTWDPQSTVHLTFDTGDANSMTGNTVKLCVFKGAYVDWATNCSSGNNYSKEVWSITDGGNLTADAGNGATFTASKNNTPDWTGTSISWDITVTVGDIARAGNDWYWAAYVYDGTLSANASYGTPATVPSFSLLTAPSARNFGSIAAGASSADTDFHLTGVKVNTAMNVKMNTTATWANGGTNISLKSNGAPGANEFALRCSGSSSVPGSAYVATSAASVDNSAIAAFTTDAVNNNVPLYCGLDNGNTPAGTYTGTVTTTLG